MFLDIFLQEKDGMLTIYGFALDPLLIVNEIKLIFKNYRSFIKRVKILFKNSYSKRIQKQNLAKRLH